MSSKLRSELESLQAETAAERRAELPLLEDARALEEKLAQWKARKGRVEPRGPRWPLVVVALGSLLLGWLAFEGVLRLPAPPKDSYVHGPVDPNGRANQTPPGF